MKVTYNLLLQYPFLRKWMRKTNIVFQVECELYFYFNSHLDNITPDYKYLIDIPKLKFKRSL